MPRVPYLSYRNVSPLISRSLSDALPKMTPAELRVLMWQVRREWMMRFWKDHQWIFKAMGVVLLLIVLCLGVEHVFYPVSARDARETIEIVVAFLALVIFGGLLSVVSSAMSCADACWRHQSRLLEVRSPEGVATGSVFGLIFWSLLITAFIVICILKSAR